MYSSTLLLEKVQKVEKEKALQDCQFLPFLASCLCPTTNCVVCKNGSSVGIYTHCIHIFARLVPICVLSRCLSTEVSASELTRKFIKSVLLVGCVLLSEFFCIASKRGEVFSRCQKVVVVLQCTEQEEKKLLFFFLLKKTALVVLKTGPNFSLLPLLFLLLLLLHTALNHTHLQLLQHGGGEGEKGSTMLTC